MTRCERGLYNMPCWNGLSEAQQLRLIIHGNLPLGYHPERTHCRRGAECRVNTESDRAPSLRFYCYPCAIKYLTEKHAEKLAETRARIAGKMEKLSPSPDLQSEPWEGIVYP